MLTYLGERGKKANTVPNSLATCVCETPDFTLAMASSFSLTLNAFLFLLSAWRQHFTVAVTLRMTLYVRKFLRGYTTLIFLQGPDLLAHVICWPMYILEKVFM